MDTPINPPSSGNGGTAAPLVALYWLIAGIPLAWGVFQTVQKSIPLFHVTSAPVAAAVAAESTPPAK